MNFDFNMASLASLSPEIFLFTMVCVILLLEAFSSKQNAHLSYQLAQGTLVGTAIIILGNYPENSVLAMNDMFIADKMGALLKLFIMLTVFMAFAYSRDYLKDRNILKGEYFILGLFAALGMMVMVSAHSFLTIYLGLELLSLSMYAMVAMHRESQQASEAAMKYFVLGALASGMLLYGISMLYGTTNSLDLAVVAERITNGQVAHKTALVFGLVFIVIGLAFKLGAVPFHMWIPDVYQGAPTAVTVFISSAPKLAAFAMLMRLLAEGMPSLQTDWQAMLIILSILSMAIGNIVAIAQTNIKRMLAYSTISHVGFLMLGVIAVTQSGYASSMFYTITYTLMSLGAFGVVILLSREGFESENITDFKGLNERSPWYAFVMLIMMLSMAGVPPFLGFWAKWSVLSELIHAGFTWLAVVAVFFSVIGAFFYLRIVKMMYFEKVEDNTPISASMDIRVVLSINGVLILLLGVIPQSLMAICLKAF